MKKAKRLYISGSLQTFVFKRFVKDHADKKEVKGFIRTLPDSKTEVFLEGESENVDALIAICKRGWSRNSAIKSIEERDERLQDFKEFKVLNI
ncbi:MAG: acylphosphatase [archaeon]|jgi:acylphosphatase|nr:acylphosphatase [archaeon]